MLLPASFVRIRRENHGSHLIEHESSVSGKIAF